MSPFDAQLPFDEGKDVSDGIDWEIGFFEGIVGSAPDYVEALLNLGNLYTRRGDHGKGLCIDKRLVELRPGDPIVHYNLACSLSLLDDIGGAVDELHRAIELGYDNYAYLLQDEDLENVRNDPRFIHLATRLHKHV